MVKIFLEDWSCGDCVLTVDGVSESVSFDTAQSRVLGMDDGVKVVLERGYVDVGSRDRLRETTVGELRVSYRWG